ncbi:hypothetical protein GE061_006474 [Apolygus lucorum]|uniref:Peptidase S1 domain-containing protein n=1 Tax=Apolygus lucorum TaxID=248454 RepID=A0A8S9WU06_APOLU|nr:hypothetical protein GE061_006474 [Apolygus lucorum]
MKGIRILILPYVWFLLRIFLAQSQSTSEECREFEYTCDSGQCVNNTVQCDGTKDCEDGSDETHFLCRQLDVTCSSPSVFRCAYGACIDKDRLCNGVKDCADNSDELHPECYKEFLASVHKNSRCDPIYNFTCHSGECVDSIALCDGYFDCKDKSDESLIECFNMTCQPNAFQCAYGACIDGYPDPKCNGTNECHDGSDELPKYCPNIATQIGSEDGPQCLLPEQPKFGKYMIGGCESGGDPDFCESEPGTPVAEDVHLIYECDRGYNLPIYPSGESAFQSVCSSNYDSPVGEWTIDITCRKNCEPIFSETLDLECLYEEKKVPCDLDVRAGTILKPRCKPFYHPLEPVTVYESTMCLDTGKWRDPLYTCVPVCGVAGNTSYTQYIAHGDLGKVGDHPWAIGMYRKDKDKDKDKYVYNHMCGGTIISYNLILTAAHCIFDDHLELVPADRFEVVMGKLNISWDSQEPTQQKIGVKTIIWPTSYKGAQRNFEWDIAVLVLVRSIKFSSIVMPACIDWKKKAVVHNNELGNIAGWGKDESQQASPILQTAKLPYKDLESCSAYFRKYNNENNQGKMTGFVQFLTVDKICAGTFKEYAETTSVQQGDSGGGLTIIRNDLHFLIGILSNHEENNNRFALYTSVRNYIDWLITNQFADTLT